MTGFARCQNGWPALHRTSRLLYTWHVPAKNGAFQVRLHNGSAGFILAHWALWFSETIEQVAGHTLDDWGYADRLVRGSETDLSNHAGGLAIDLNAMRHPLGKVGTYTKRQRTQLQARLRWALYAGCLRNGMNYHGRKDEMHTEIVRNLSACERVARRLERTSRGKRLLAANPSQAAVIAS